MLALIKENCNCKIVLADELAAELMTPGHDTYERVVRLPWDRLITNPDGTIDRPAMAASMFANDELREMVNSIVHPAVRFEILNQVEKAREAHNIEYFFFEAALLIECDYDKIVDELWYIYATPEVRRARLKRDRGYSDVRIDNTFASQLSDEEFRRHASFIIDNSGDFEATARQIKDKLNLE